MNECISQSAPPLLSLPPKVVALDHEHSGERDKRRKRVRVE